MERLHYYVTNLCVVNTISEKYGIKFTFCVNTGCGQNTVRRTNHRLAYRNFHSTTTEDGYI